MNNFNKGRFLSVAKWDMTINRQFYLKSAILLFVLMALPTFIAICKNNVLEQDFLGIPTYVTTAGTAITTLNIYIGLLPLLFVYTFHNLTSRQGRINELTLPASNLEKYLCHILLILIGSLAVAAVSFFVLDFVHYLCTSANIGFHSDNEFITSMVKVARSELWRDLSLNLNWNDNFPFTIWGYLFCLSAFILGNAYKYKHNLLLTIMWLFVVSFLFAILSTRIRMGGLDLILIILTVLCWVQSFRLYTHAELTTKRNR